MHADWFRRPQYSLVGAMDDKDAQLALKLAPQAKYVKLEANHVIHFFKPDQFIAEVNKFAKNLK